MKNIKQCAQQRISLDLCVYACASLLTLIALAYPALPLTTLILDTEQYHQAHSGLLRGDLFSTSPEARAALKRPPLYPLLLCLEQGAPSIAGVPPIVFIHITLASLVFLIVPHCMKPSVPRSLAAIGLGISLYSVKKFAWADMSEWLAMCFLLLAFGSMVRLFYLTRASSAFLMMLWVSCGTLTRTALAPFLMFAISPLLFLRSFNRRKIAVCCLAGVAPLVAWNICKVVNSTSLVGGAYEASNLFASSRSFSEIPVYPEDTPETVRFITILNDRGATSHLESLRPSQVHEWNGAFYHAFHTNFSLVDQLLDQLNPPPQISPQRVFIRTIKRAPQAYWNFIKGGIFTCTDSGLPLVVISIIISGWLYFRSTDDRPFCIAAISVALVTAIYVGTIMSVMLWLPRYFVPIQPTLLLCVLVGGYRLCRSFAPPYGYITPQGTKV